MYLARHMQVLLSVRRYCRSQHHVNLYAYQLIQNSCQMDKQLRSCCTRYVYAHSRSHILSYNCGYILNSETTVYFTSILNCLVAVPVQGYVHVHTKNYITSIYSYVINLFYNVVLYRLEFCLFSTRTCLSLVRQTFAFVCNMYYVHYIFHRADGVSTV